MTSISPPASCNFPSASGKPPPRYDMVLELIALAGDFPTNLLDKLDGSYFYTRDIVTELLSHKLIRRYQKNKLKSLRLTQKGRNLLLSHNYNRFCRLLEGAGKTRAQKTEIAPRLRMHRMAAAYLLMLEQGVRVHRDEKAPIFEVEPGEISSETKARIMSFWATPCYYSSVEIKYLPLATRRIQGTRALGLLLTEAPRPRQASIPYLVYCTGLIFSGWNRDKERQIARSLFTALNLWECHYGHACAIMIGENIDILKVLMQIPDKRHKNTFYSIAENSGFEHFHFISLDANGKLLLRYLCDVDAKRAFEEHIRAEYDEKPERYESFAYQAYDKQAKRYIFFGWDMDMQRIYSFQRGLERYGHKGTILCFDFQADIYRDLFGDLADIRLLEINSLKKEMFDGA